LSSDPRATEQANVPPSLANLPLRFWLIAILTGVCAGAGAMAFMGVLRAVQHAAFGYRTGEYSAAAARSSDERVVAVLVVGGLVAGVGWWALYRFAGGTGGEPTEVVWSGSGSLSPTRTIASGTLSEVAVGLGMSLGREAAPQHTGAALGFFLARRFCLPADQATLLIACGAGAGVGAVYNVPFAGALFAAELYLGSISLTTLVPALVISAVATAVSWITLPAQAVYKLPTLTYPSLGLVTWALLVGPLIGLASAGYVRAIGWASDRRPKDRRLLFEPLFAFAFLGLIAIKYPLLLGNGRDLAQFALTGKATLLTLLALTALKPIVTTGCLRSGAGGGLFTPTFSFGATLGALLGHARSYIWPGLNGPSYGAVGAAAMLGAAMQAPVAGIAFVLELTNETVPIVVPIVLAIAGATIVSRRFEMRSIYSSRISPSKRPELSTIGHR
jgi:CIC family chloride channel protein